MSNIEYHKNLFSLLNQANNFSIDANRVEIDSQDPNLIQGFEEIGGNVEKIGAHSIHIPTNSLKTKIFGSIRDFLSTKTITNDSNLLIVEKEPISYIDSETYNNFKLSKDDFLIINAKSYLEFQEFLKSQEQETDESFHFVDVYNFDFRKLTFVSLADKGRLTVKYNSEIPDFDRKIDYSVGFSQFKECFEEKTKNLAKFLKASLIDAASSYSSDLRFQQLFIHLDDIVLKAKQNFEVFLNNLSIDKIKKEYGELKSKYFNDLSDILSKLTNKIIVLPIGITASLIAIDKIDEVPFFLFFLLFATLLTSIYLSLLLRIHFRDIRYIEVVFTADYQSLTENNFFTKYPDEKRVFEEIKGRIEKRITFLKVITESYFWILNLSNTVIIGYILSALGMPLMGIVLTSLALLLGITLARNYVIDNETK